MTWEYLLLVGIAAAERTPDGTDWTYPTRFEIWGPGTVREKRDSTGIDSVVVLLNELGGQGWELIDAATTNATVIPTAEGWPNVSHPVARRYYFKRQVGAR